MLITADIVRFILSTQWRTQQGQGCLENKRKWMQDHLEAYAFRGSIFLINKEILETERLYKVNQFHSSEASQHSSSIVLVLMASSELVISQQHILRQEERNSGFGLILTTFKKDFFIYVYLCVSVYVRWVCVSTEARGIRFLWSLSYNCEHMAERTQPGNSGRISTLNYLSSLSSPTN